MTLRLFYDYFIGETTTIGYDYFSRNAATIVRPYWLSGESPKRAVARAANGSAPPAGLPRRVEGASRCTLTADPVSDHKPPGVGSIETAAGLTLCRWRR